MKLKFTAIGAIAAMFAFSASATEVGAQIDLTPNLRAKVLSVDGQNHKVEVFANPDNKPTGDVEIKNTYFIGLNNYTVTRIATKGFSYTDITGITTGIDMRIIGSQAFYGCTRLAYYKEYEAGSVEVIGDEAFGHTYALSSISLPAVVHIGDYAFMRSGLKSASFPAIKELGGAAFYECFSLASFTGGEHLLTVGNIAFANCKPLVGVTLGPQLTTMGTMTLAFTEVMTQIVIPQSVTTIGKDSFSGSAINRVFVLAPKFMDFCDESRIFRNTNIKKVYCIPSLTEAVTKYLAAGSTANPASSLTKATVAPITEVLDLEKKGGNNYAPVKKLEGITDLHLYDAVSGAEIPAKNGLYEITADAVRISYRIDDINLLDYTMSMSGSGSVDGIEVDDDNAPAEYYNLQGIRVDRPEKGIYIRHTAKGSSLIAL